MADEEKVPSEESEQAPMKISRRDFLVGAGAGVVVTGVAAAVVISTRQPETVEVIKEVPVPGEPAPAPAPEVSRLVEGTTVITLKVNGVTQQVVVEPQTTLAELLRRDLGLTGTHIGCNGSYCSNCTVLVNGVAQNSCSLLAVREAGKEIVTIEGLAVEGALHPLQQAFWDEMAYQCGFCTSGQIMRAAELLNNVKNPSEAQIRRHMAGNMCKCSAYPNIIRAIQQAAKQMA
ncbi:MAG TPA: (2Fe-2S)-binding protein [Anaerolineales bacterium]|nr:(2Fe-2S)-binding protein [Anaerolineales bacterium]